MIAVPVSSKEDVSRVEKIFQKWGIDYLIPNDAVNRFDICSWKFACCAHPHHSYRWFFCDDTIGGTLLNIEDLDDYLKLSSI